MYLSQNLKYLMDKNSISRADLANKLNVSYNQTGKYLKGVNQPKIEGLVALGQLFDVTVDDLILIDLSQEEGRPFGGGVEAGSTTDEQLTLVNKLLMQRVHVLEREMKEDNPDLARDLGIE
jgi:transcriptional regulator with XRE-family HTH domain